MNFKRKYVLMNILKVSKDIHQNINRGYLSDLIFFLLVYLYFLFFLL